MRERYHSLLLSVFVRLLKFRGQPKFGKWIQLEEQKNRILETVEESSDEFPDELLSFLSTVLHLPVKYFEHAFWENIFFAFYTCLKLTHCQIDIPLLSSTEPSKDKPAWDYHGRKLHLYLHMLSKAYGWTLEYSSNLETKTAISLIQEILTDEQMEAEFWWMLSDRSTTYDSTTKTAKANPYPRPDWMHKHIDPEKEIPKTTIPTDMMPLGKALTVEDVLSKT